MLAVHAHPAVIVKEEIFLTFYYFYIQGELSFIE